MDARLSISCFVTASTRSVETQKKSGGFRRGDSTIVGPGVGEVERGDLEGGGEPLDAEEQVVAIAQSEARAGDSVGITRHLHHGGHQEGSLVRMEGEKSRVVRV